MYSAVPKSRTTESNRLIDDGGGGAWSDDLWRCCPYVIWFRYRECLMGAANKFGCDVHAYVLMTNHVHLLVTPVKPDAVSRMMQSIGRRFVQYMNFTSEASG